DLIGAECSQHADERSPVCAYTAAVIHHLIENAGKRAVGGDQCVEACSVAFGRRLERGAYRHFLLDSPPQVEGGRIFKRDTSSGGASIDCGRSEPNARASLRSDGKSSADRQPIVRVIQQRRGRDLYPAAFDK